MTLLRVIPTSGWDTGAPAVGHVGDGGSSSWRDYLGSGVGCIAAGGSSSWRDYLSSAVGYKGWSWSELVLEGLSELS